MTGDGGTARLRLVPADGSDPAGRLLADLPPAWHGEVIGPGIDGWETIVEGGRDRPIRLPGLPARLRHEIAWMAHWQHCDGLKVSVDVCKQLASMLAWADESGRPLPSLAWAGKRDLLRLHGVWFHALGARRAVACRAALHAKYRCVLRADKAVVGHEVPVPRYAEHVGQQPADCQAGRPQGDEGADGMKASASAVVRPSARTRPQTGLPSSGLSRSCWSSGIPRRSDASRSRSPSASTSGAIPRCSPRSLWPRTASRPGDDATVDGLCDGRGLPLDPVDRVGVLQAQLDRVADGVVEHGAARRHRPK